MERKVTYPGLALPYALLAPQILIILVFFYLPAGQALWMSTLLQDPLGLSVQFVGLENFVTVLSDPAYRQTIARTFFFSIMVTLCAMVPAILLAFMADKVIRGATAYKTILIIPTPSRPPSPARSGSSCSTRRSASSRIGSGASAWTGTRASRAATPWR